MDVNIVSVRIQTLVKDKGIVHETAWVYHGALFVDRHLLQVNEETAIKDLLVQGALTPEYHNLTVVDLIGERHVSRHPLPRIHFDFLWFVFVTFLLVALIFHLLILLLLLLLQLLLGLLMREAI